VVPSGTVRLVQFDMLFSTLVRSVGLCLVSFPFYASSLVALRSRTMLFDQQLVLFSVAITLSDFL